MTANEQLLVSYAWPAFQPSCTGLDPVYEGALAAITCETGDAPIAYTLFSTADRMDVAYYADVANAATPPHDGACADGNTTSIYGFEDGRSGNLYCHDQALDTGTFHIIEWTEQGTKVISQLIVSAETHSWDDAYSLFVDRGGPYAYD
jgi:hypothetical protein